VCAAGKSSGAFGKSSGAKGFGTCADCSTPTFTDQPNQAEFLACRFGKRTGMADGTKCDKDRRPMYGLVVALICGVIGAPDRPEECGRVGSSQPARRGGRSVAGCGGRRRCSDY